jgi:hypothetical protein
MTALKTILRTAISYLVNQPISSHCIIPLGNKVIIFCTRQFFYFIQILQVA